jgi:SAM-dependent methyltransferase
VSSDDVSRRILRAHLRELPWHRVITRSIEARILHDISFPRPLLDVGCGDGHFASVIFPEGADVGLDPGLSDAQEARARRVYRLVVNASSLAIPFANGSFASVLSNCVLEHIPDLDTTLAQISRVLAPGGLFVCTVISHRFSDLFIPSAGWSRLGLGRVREAYVRWFNRKARHFHFDSPQRWTERFGRAGLVVDRWRYYSSAQASAAAHRSHYESLPLLLLRKATGKWVPFPNWMDRPIWRRRFARYVDEPEPSEGACIAFVCRRAGATPVK